MNLNVLYGMVGTLILVVLFPPWETPPAQPPEFLGIHFFLSPPTPEAIVSRMLLTIELTTVTIGGLYAAFFFRRRPSVQRRLPSVTPLMRLRVIRLLKMSR